MYRCVHFVNLKETTYFLKNYDKSMFISNTDRKKRMLIMLKCCTFLMWLNIEATLESL